MLSKRKHGKYILNFITEGKEGGLGCFPESVEVELRVLVEFVPPGVDHGVEETVRVGLGERGHD